MSWSLIAFAAASAVALGGAVGVVLARNVVYAAFALLVSLFGVAALFLVAFAEFLALAQVLIYGGAIVIVILFVLMLTRIRDFENLTANRQWPFAGVAALGVFALLAGASLATSAPTLAERKSVGFQELGRTLFEQWAIPFEIASLVLLVALIGVVALVGGGEGRR